MKGYQFVGTSPQHASYPASTQGPPFHSTLRCHQPASATPFEGDRLPGNLNDVIREILDWFDTYLGPLRSAP